MKKSNIGAIIRKEFNRFFTDRRLVMTAIILPGLMIYLLYSFMGSAMSDMYSVEDDFAPTVYAVNAPASIAALAQEAGFYDQSHFIHDFSHICGVAPGAYLQNLSAFYNEIFKF